MVLFICLSKFSLHILIFLYIHSLVVQGVEEADVNCDIKLIHYDRMYKAQQWYIEYIDYKYTFLHIGERETSIFIYMESKYYV